MRRARLSTARLGWEVEVVSLAARCARRAYGRKIEHSGIRRRANCSGIEEVTDAEPDDIPTRLPGAFIVNPDGAVVRSGLVATTQPDMVSGNSIADRLPHRRRGAERGQGSGSSNSEVRGKDCPQA